MLEYKGVPGTPSLGAGPYWRMVLGSDARAPRDIVGLQLLTGSLMIEGRSIKSGLFCMGIAGYADQYVELKRA